MTRSVMQLYKGGTMTKKKYKDLRKQNWELMLGVQIPKPVPYDRLQAFIRGINMGEVCDLQEFATKISKPSVYEVYRPLESHLLLLADMYLYIDRHNKILQWSNEVEGKFIVALGADGAPFGKNETATAFVVSFLNILDGVQSCDNNFVLLGANCDETHPLMFEYTKQICNEMKQIEQKTYEVQGKQIKFECLLIPSDQKWIASIIHYYYCYL
ncbi:hypothetical protein QZH41_012076 [Actinostola sp. cb2023]|nr:hypothetical protein QZH41_012076 [Actinostola sp. cb2023]